MEEIYYSPLERASNLPQNASAVAVGVLFQPLLSDTGTLVVDGVFVKPMGGEARMAGRFFSYLYNCIIVCSTGSVRRGHC